MLFHPIPTERNEVKTMKKRICRALLILSCILLLNALWGCSREQLPQDNEGSKAPTTQMADTDDQDEPSDPATDTPPESETDTREPQTEGNSDGGSETDQDASVDPEEMSDPDAEAPKDPNQGEWDPQP
jgi:hypothetical protein